MLILKTMKNKSPLTLTMLFFSLMFLLGLTTAQAESEFERGFNAGRASCPTLESTVRVISTYCICSDSYGTPQNINQDLMLVQTLSNGKTFNYKLGTFRSPDYSSFGLNKSCPAALKERPVLCGTAKL